MKEYDVKVKIISQSDFEVKAKNEEEAMDIAEKIVLKTKFLLLNIDSRKVEVEAIEKGTQNECENCEYYCKSCGSCTYQVE